MQPPTFLFCCLQSKTHVQTLLQRVILVHQTDESPIQRVRQRSAFPPNFIHSIDSSHMMLTAIACQRAGQFVETSCTLCLQMRHHSQGALSVNTRQHHPRYATDKASPMTGRFDLSWVGIVCSIFPSVVTCWSLTRHLASVMCLGLNNCTCE